jgi:hypothetical protein
LLRAFNSFFTPVSPLERVIPETARPARREGTLQAILLSL